MDDASDLLIFEPKPASCSICLNSLDAIGGFHFYGLHLGYKNSLNFSCFEIIIQEIKTRFDRFASKEGRACNKSNLRADMRIREDSRRSVRWSDTKRVVFVAGNEKMIHVMGLGNRENHFQSDGGIAVPMMGFIYLISNVSVPIRMAIVA